MASQATPRHERALLDTSVVIDFPASAEGEHTSSGAISTITLAELAYGLHTPDPLTNASREQRYHWILRTFDPISSDPDAARTYGALCASVRGAGHDPKPRRLDLLIAAVAVSLGLPLITRKRATSATFTHPCAFIPSTERFEGLPESLRLKVVRVLGLSRTMSAGHS